MVLYFNSTGHVSIIPVVFLSTAPDPLKEPCVRVENPGKESK